MTILGTEIEKILFDKSRNVYNLYSANEELIFIIPDILLSTLLNDSMLVEFENILTEGEMKNRAIERIAQLRNLSFGTGGVNVYKEFNEVPAYLRRNVELNDPKELNVFVATSSNKEGNIINAYEFSYDLPDNYAEPVFIFLPKKEINIFEAEKLTNYCGDFMEALDFELETENEPIIGSYIQKLWFKIRKGTKVSKDQVMQDFAKGKKALELKYVELPTAEQTEKLANSAAKIVELLDKQEEGIVRLGAIIVLKKQVDGKPKIIVQQLNFDLISLFDKTPQLLLNLQTAYEVLTGDVKGAKRLDETGTETLSQ